MNYKIILSKQAVKDVEKLKNAGLYEKAKYFIDIIGENPFQNPPEYEKLNGYTAKTYSRRLNRRHRFVYDIFEDEKIIHVLSMWTHYEI